MTTEAFKALQELSVIALGEGTEAQSVYTLELTENISEALTPPTAPEVGEAEQLAQRFHEAYERLAPSFSYETRKASAKPWAEVPENNKRLMIAVGGEIQAASQSKAAWLPIASAPRDGTRILLKSRPDMDRCHMINP